MSITGGIGTRAIAIRYPVTSGITAETTKTEGRERRLIAEEGSVVADDERRGLE